MGENLFSAETGTETVEEITPAVPVITLVDETEPEPVVTVTAEDAAECIVVAATSWSAAQDALATAEMTFRASALAVVEAGKSGVADLAIANAVKEIKRLRPEIKGLSTDLYSSPTSVGYHRRAGLVLSLEGELPEGVTARDVQTIIKGLPAKQADAIIGEAKDQAAAHKALSLALEGVKAAKAAEAAAASEDDEESESGSEKIKDAAHMLKSALNTITKASEMTDDDWTDEAVRLAAMISDTLAQRLSVLPSAVPGHLTVVGA